MCTESCNQKVKKRNEQRWDQTEGGDAAFIGSVELVRQSSVIICTFCRVQREWTTGLDRQQPFLSTS